MSVKSIVFKSSSSVRRITQASLIPRALSFSSSSSASGSSQRPRSRQQLYTGHIPTNCFQKALLGVLSAGVAIINPERGDMVAALGEVTASHSHLSELRAAMLSTPEGLAVLTDRPRVLPSHIDYDALSRLPPSTFGFHYYDWLSRHNLSPSTRTPVHFIDSAELSFVLQRYRDIHDFLHVLFNLPPTIAAEVILKRLEAHSTALPVAHLSALGGLLSVCGHGQTREYQWYAAQGVKGCKVMEVYYEKKWEVGVEEVRREMGIEPFEEYRGG